MNLPLPPPSSAHQRVDAYLQRTHFSPPPSGLHPSRAVSLHHQLEADPEFAQVKHDLCEVLHSPLTPIGTFLADRTPYGLEVQLLVDAIRISCANSRLDKLGVIIDIFFGWLFGWILNIGN